MTIESSKNLPTIMALIIVVVLIALLPEYKENLRSLNHNVAGLMLGFICVIMFLVIRILKLQFYYYLL